MVYGDACAVGRTLHAAADKSIVWPPGVNGVTAVHVDGGIRAVLSAASSGALQCRWENERMLSG